jgi:hypothetical protein
LVRDIGCTAESPEHEQSEEGYPRKVKKPAAPVVQNGIGISCFNDRTPEARCELLRTAARLTLIVGLKIIEALF